MRQGGGIPRSTKLGEPCARGGHTPTPWSPTPIVHAAILACALALATPLRAQDSVMVIDPDAPFADSAGPGVLPPAVVQQLLRTWNDSGTTRFSGTTLLAPGSRLTGPVALYRGALRVGGIIEGSVTVINGNLILLPGGRITGDVLVVGGRLVKQEGSTLEGKETVYWDLAPVARASDGSLAPQKTPDLETLGSAQASFGVGKIRTTVHASFGGTYDRVEGFPLELGPAFVWKATPRDRVHLDLTGILRTSSDNTDTRSDFGYRARLEWRRLGEVSYGVGGRAWSVIDVIPNQTLSRSESGWTSILIQDDQYDYYNSENLGVYGFLLPARQLRLDLAWNSDRQSSVSASNPFSLFVNDARWRANPLVDDGTYALTSAAVTLDTRDSDREPSSGWYGKAAFEYGTSDNVAPVDLPTGIRGTIPTDGTYEYTLLTLDARRYFRLSPDDRLSARGYFSGWVGGDPLPMQRRLSLGGPGVLPGDAFRQVNCPSTGPTLPSEASLCDRTIFFQAEYRHRLNLGWHVTITKPTEDNPGRVAGVQGADLVFLSDVGTAWLTGTGPSRVPNDRLPSADYWSADIGVGIDFGFLAAYLAKSVTDDGPLRLSLRLQRRF